MGIFDKKDDKSPESRPDFSNVRSGGSSMAPAAPPADGHDWFRQDVRRRQRGQSFGYRQAGIWGCQQVADDLRGQQRPHQ